MADEHPVRITLTDDALERNRWSVFFRLLLALPHLIVVGTFAMVAIVMAPILWIVTLVRAEPPRGLAEFYGRLVLYAAQVEAYLHLAAAPFPPFFGRRGSYAIEVELPLPERQNRWTIAFRGVLAFPAIALSGALSGGVGTGGYTSIRAGVLPTVAVLGWFACLARGRMPRGFRDLLVYSLGYVAQVYAYLFFLTGRYPNSDPALAPVAELPEHAVRLDIVDDDLRRSRLTVFFRILLAVPHFVWLVLWSIAGIVVSLVGWFCALALGRLPLPLHRFLAALQRYSTHVGAFVNLAANPFPGFTGATGRYPVELTIDGPVRQSRWSVLFRLVLAVPAILASSAVSSAAGIAAVMGWFAALFTGRMPRGVRNLIAYSLRYSAQVGAYVGLLTPRYPYSGPGRCASPAAPPQPAAAEAFG